MSAYKLPKQIVFWAELPKSAYGKVAKRAVKDKLASMASSEDRPAVSS